MSDFSENGGWQDHDGLLEEMERQATQLRDLRIAMAESSLLVSYQRHGAQWLCEQLADWSGGEIAPASEEAAVLWAAIEDYAEPREPTESTVGRIAQWLYQQIEAQKKQGAA